MGIFEWDRANLSHVAEHGVSSTEAEQVITNDPFDLEFQTVNGEERIVQLGETTTGRILVVVSTWRAEKIRVVTAFPAVKALKALYLAQKGSSYGEGIQDP